MKLKRREKILIIFVPIAMAIWAFDYFYYAPQTKNIRRLKEEIKQADLKLAESLPLIKGIQLLEVDVLRQEEELKRLKERTSKGDEFRTFLKHLAKESDPLQMKVISILPQEEKQHTPEGKKEATPSLYKRVNIQVVLHSTFSKLGTYIKGIEELPFLISIENLRVERNEESHPLLKITMGLNIYISGGEKDFKVPRI